MAEAYECDRCGNLYKKYDDFAPPYRYKDHVIKIMSYENENDCWPKALDLCPICMREIINTLTTVIVMANG